MATLYTVRRGETLLLYLEAVSGDPATVLSSVAKLKGPGIADPIVLPMVLRPTQPSPGIGIPGWYVTVPDTVTAGAQALGNYLVDAAVHIAGATFVTETITIQVISSVSLTS
jgi:hypothetical protein